ncbi:hypothetical protein KSX_68790 [Ktedonospora formicarum]|uniref:DUF4010 domain-containing protein n=1 Tax=Ktedonospora formicarum TaxID=2778364 RepID=A0A8J3MW88_9CHLR|nr:hypothetical protein KSX_68790 [Ktedonospora formicarum]
MNSVATAALLGREAKQGAVSVRDVPGHLLRAVFAMLIRDGLLLCLFLLPQWPLTGIAPLMVLGSMAVITGLLTFFVERSGRGRRQPPLPHRLLRSPLALRSVGGFGLLFSLLFVLSGLAKQFFGASGLLLVVIAGALASTASSSVLLGQQLTAGAISGIIAASAMWLVALVGLMENAIIFWITSSQSAPVGRLFLFYIPILFAGGFVVILASLLR